MVTKKIKKTTEKLKETSAARHFNNIGYSKLELMIFATVWGGGSLILLPRLIAYAAKNPQIRILTMNSLRDVKAAMNEVFPFRCPKKP